MHELLNFHRERLFSCFSSILFFSSYYDTITIETTVDSCDVDLYALTTVYNIFLGVNCGLKQIGTCENCEINKIKETNKQGIYQKYLMLLTEIISLKILAFISEFINCN